MPGRNNGGGTRTEGKETGGMGGRGEGILTRFCGGDDVLLARRGRLWEDGATCAIKRGKGGYG